MLSGSGSSARINAALESSGGSNCQRNHWLVLLYYPKFQFAEQEEAKIWWKTDGRAVLCHIFASQNVWCVCVCVCVRSVRLVRETEKETKAESIIYLSLQDPVHLQEAQKCSLLPLCSLTTQTVPHPQPPSCHSLTKENKEDFLLWSSEDGGAEWAKRQRRGRVGAEEMSRLPCTWLLLRPSASPISSSYDPTLLWIPTPLYASSRYNKHWNPPLPYFTLFSALSLHLHPWASPLSPNILPGMEGAEHSTCLDPSRHHRPVDLSWKGWVVEEHGWVWMESWGGYSCRLKVKVGGWGISALMEKTQRKQEVTPLTHPEACGVTQLTLGQPRVFSFLPWCSCAILVYSARVLRRFNVAI